MTWIRTIAPDEATGDLKELYSRISTSSKKPDNIILAHSLRPHTLEGHLNLYRSVLHHSANTLPRWFLESIGVYVSQLNHCSYCVDHHSAGLRKLLQANDKAESINSCLAADRPERFFHGKELLLLQYAKKLTLQPDLMNADDLRRLQTAGIDDGQILEVNQVTAYFCYANRMVLGLGIDTTGDELGNSPSTDDNPNH